MQKTPFIRFGDFLFKTRNWLFPTLIIGLCLMFVPAEHGVSALAYGMVATGLAIRACVIGFAYIKRGGMNKQVYADKLVTTGLFGLCRNPLYVGNILIYSGVFVKHGNPVVMAFGIAMFVVFYLAIVAAEEFFLRGKFGAEYDAYCADVPRWLPRPAGLIARFKAATHDMDYDFKRVLFKDYSTIINAFIPLVLLEFYTEELFSPNNATLTPLVLVAIACGLAVAAYSIRSLKKRESKKAV